MILTCFRVPVITTACHIHHVLSLSVLMAMLADTRMSPFWILLELRMIEVVVAIGAIRRAKIQSNHHQQTNTQLYTGRMLSLSPNQQCQSTEGKQIYYVLLQKNSEWFDILVLACPLCLGHCLLNKFVFSICGKLFVTSKEIFLCKVDIIIMLCSKEMTLDWWKIWRMCNNTHAINESKFNILKYYSNMQYCHYSWG